MDFNPADISAFQEKGPKTDPNIYKTNPKDSKSDDGNYRSKVRVIYNPFNIRESIIPQASYWLNMMDGSMPVRSSLSVQDKSCPLFRGWKRLWFSGDESKKEFAKKVYDKTESQWVLVQILEDENKPELAGQFRVMKLAKDIYDKLNARMNPTGGKAPYPVMDYVIGLTLEMDVQPGPDDPKAPERKQREISYSLCNFTEFAPIIQTDGTPLLSDEEIELVENYVTAINDSQNGKTEKKKKDGAAKITELKPQLIPIYEKVANYVKDNVKDLNTNQPLNIKEYCGYMPWDAETTDKVNKFVEMTDACVDPSTISYNDFKRQQANGFAQEVASETAEAVAEETTSTQPDDAGDLPF